MPQDSEKWRTEPATHYWENWRIQRERGWYVIRLCAIGLPAVPIKFRSLINAKTFCETLDALRDWAKVSRMHNLDRLEKIVGHKATWKRAAVLMSLDISTSRVADDLRDLAKGRKGEKTKTHRRKGRS